MDFAWVPGGDKPSKLAKHLCRNRVLAPSLDTTLIEKKPVKLVTDLLVDLDLNASPKPIGDLLLISHGLPTGWLALDLDSAAGTTTDFQVLHEILDTTKPASVHRKAMLTIPSSLYTTATNTQAPTRVLLGGCRVGKAPKFVDAFKKVLGDKVPVVAPKHFHIFSSRFRKLPRKKIPDLVGTYEFLCYAFETTSLKPLNRDDLVTKLAANLDNTLIDGSSVPVSQWKQWLPRRVPSGEKTLNLPITVSLGRTIEKQKELTYGEFRHQIPTFRIKFDNPTPALLTVAGMRAACHQDPRFDANWGFPMHEQWGNSSVDDFVDSFNWTPTKGKNRVVWTGLRHEYLVLVPITDPTMPDPQKLFYNFFPLRGSTLTAFKELDETNSDLFYTTP